MARAISHGEALARAWNVIPTEELYKPEAMVRDDGFGFIRLSQVKPVPEEFSLLLGELLYQLRSALDACIYQATVYTTGENPPSNEDQLEFPICSTSAEFNRQSKRRLSALSEPVRHGIEQLQPYNMPALPPEKIVSDMNRSLGLLHDLARKDRHRRLHVLGSWAHEVNPEFDLPPGVTVTWIEVMKSGYLESDNVLATFQLSSFTPGMKIRASPKLWTNVGLNEPPVPCHVNDSFDRRLAEMVNAVSSVVSAFEKYF